MKQSDAPTDETLLALAGRLTASIGGDRPRALTRLSGGKNNQVYRIEMATGALLVLKRYFDDSRDRRHRLSTEWEFLNRAWAGGVRAIPQPLSRDEASHAALYSFTPGRKLHADELSPAHVDSAADFIVAINAMPSVDAPPASEACFCIAEHLQAVERRLSRLASLDPQAPHVDDAQIFISRVLLPAWDGVKRRLERDAHALGLSLQRRLPPQQCCLSPSDFGFHNAIVTDDGGLVFLDFEYAGRDDPAKLVVDFFCQPEIPVPLSFRGPFTARLAQGLGLDQAATARCEVLLDACRIKWACIILNDFLALGAARRAFADAGDWDIRCANQIAKARAKIAEIDAPEQSFLTTES